MSVLNILALVQKFQSLKMLVKMCKKLIKLLKCNIIVLIFFTNTIFILIPILMIR